MRVWAETNFLLEIILEQAEQAACREILALAEAASIQLAIPAICFVEADRTLRRRRFDLTAFTQEAGEKLHQVARSAAIARQASDAAKALRSIDAWVTQQTDSEMRELRRRVLAVAVVLPLDVAALDRIDREQTFEDLQFPDAAVLATILADPALGRGPGAFLARDQKAFDDPDIRTLLGSRDCKVITSFSGGLAHVKHHLGGHGGGGPPPTERV